jgi:hypothetical protein
MIEPVPDKLAGALRQTLARGERVFVQLRGAFQEALVCTDYRVIILKGGWMTGQWFGTDLFQCPYANVAGAQVSFHLLTGYFELSAGGMQNTRKSFWNSDAKVSAAKAPNCVAISGRERADRFRAACAFIMHRANHPHGAPANPSENAMVATLQQLAKLRDTGVISEAEFKAKKSEILSRI